MYTCTLQTLKFMSDCVCVCVWVYLSLYMARIYGCGVVNVAAYLVSVCEMHFMNLLWLLMWRHLHRATHSHPHTHAHTRTGSGRHLALTLCGTGVTQSTPTSGLAGVRLDGRCHKRDKERGAGGDARQRSTPLPLLPHSWMRNLLTRQQRISSWPNPCRAWLSLSAAHEIFAAERGKKEKVRGNFTKQQSCRCILIYVLLRAG